MDTRKLYNNISERAGHTDSPPVGSMPRVTTVPSWMSDVVERSKLEEPQRPKRKDEKLDVAWAALMQAMKQNRPMRPPGRPIPRPPKVLAIVDGKWQFVSESTPSASQSRGQHHIQHHQPQPPTLVHPSVTPSFYPHTQTSSIVGTRYDTVRSSSNVTYSGAHTQPSSVLDTNYDNAISSSNVAHSRPQPRRVAQLKAGTAKDHRIYPATKEGTARAHKATDLVESAGSTSPIQNRKDDDNIFQYINWSAVDELQEPEIELDVNDDDDNDNLHHGITEQSRCRLTKDIQQMMFVSGETAEPSAETTWMIEEIVREQVVEMLRGATNLANRRGSKSISIMDLIFQIRQNTAKVSRLKTFLSWKDVRKNVKDSDDKAGGADADALDLEDGGPMGANPAAPQKTQGNKKAKLILPWEVQSYFSETVPEREDEEDEEEEEQNEATLARLASADERTKNMTKEEYVYWSECRQASFTFRKGKRFREWAGFGTIIDSKPNDDVVDILGFLTFEIVQTLTEEALQVKKAEDLANKKAGVGDLEASKKRKREVCSLFEMPEEGRTPIEPRHVQEAFRRLQIIPKKYTFMRNGKAGTRTPLRMI